VRFACGGHEEFDIGERDVMRVGADWFGITGRQATNWERADARKSSRNIQLRKQIECLYLVLVYVSCY